jgi:outer membrane lipoprotein-sorting protein
MVPFCSHLAVHLKHSVHAVHQGQSVLDAWSARAAALVVGLAVLFCGRFTAKAGEASPLLRSWFAAQTNLQTWSADLTQTRSLKALAQPLTARGHVWFAAPNRFRWELTSPSSTIAVREPEQMLVIYPQLKRAERYSLRQEASGPWKDTLALLEAGFPRSQTELESQFRLLSETVNSSGLCELTLQPRAPAARRLMPQIKIAFATNDLRLRATELQFADGSTLRNDFSNDQLNPPLDDALFAPKLDSDVTIVDPLRQAQGEPLKK